MALESAIFFVEDYKGRHYKVHATSESILGKKEYLWCTVYNSLGVTDGVEQRRIYEENYSAVFSLYENECLDLDDLGEVELVIRNKFNDSFWVKTWIDNSNYEPSVNETPNKKADDEIFQCEIKTVLEDYHNLDLESMTVADALESLSEVTEKMSELLEKYLQESK